jgi:hypothetical protein
VKDGWFFPAEYVADSSNWVWYLVRNEPRIKTYNNSVRLDMLSRHISKAVPDV